MFMSRRLRAFSRGIAALACVLACAPSLFAQDADIVGNWDVTVTAGQATQAKDAPIDVSGTWNFQVEIGGNTGTPTMTFKQEGEKLTGRYTGQLGEAPLTGTLKGNAIEFSFDISIEGNTVRIIYAGTVEKDSMKGTAKFGDFGEGAFTAKRKP